MKKKEKKNREPIFALVPCVPRNRVAQTPFEAFIQELSRYFSEETTSVGAVRWTTFPVEYALASGFWPLLVAIAKELRVSLATPTEVAFVATKVNQLVCASISAIFPEVKMMVTVFEKDVVRLLERAIELGYRPGMKTSLALWRQLRDGEAGPFEEAIHQAKVSGFSGDAHLLFQAPVALFFMELVQRARKKYCVWREEYEKLKVLNVFSEELVCYWAEVEDDLRVVKAGLEMFDLSLGAGARSYTGNDDDFLVNNISLVREIEGRLKLSRREIELARKLPLNGLALKERMGLDLCFNSSIDYSWGHSQLLLAAGNLPDRDWILTTEFSVALAALKQMESTELVEKTLLRWREQRNFSPTEQDLLAVRNRLLRLAKSMQHWTAPKSRRSRIIPIDMDFTLYERPKTKGRF